MRFLIAVALCALSAACLAAEAKPKTAAAPVQPQPQTERPVEELLQPKPFYTLADLPRTYLETALSCKIKPEKIHGSPEFIESSAEHWQMLCANFTGKVFVGQAVVESVKQEGDKIIIDARRALLRRTLEHGGGVALQFILSTTDKAVLNLRPNALLTFQGLVKEATARKTKDGESFNVQLGGWEATNSENRFDVIATIMIDLQKCKWATATVKNDRDAISKDDRKLGNPYAHIPFPDAAAWIAELKKTPAQRKDEAKLAGYPAKQ